MGKKVSICLLVFFLLSCTAGLFYLYLPKEDGQGELQAELEAGTQEPIELQESMSIQEPYYAYLIKEMDGMLAVYDADGAFLFETGIRVEYLDTKMQEKAHEGIRISDEKELYDFLESYSS